MRGNHVGYSNIEQSSVPQGRSRAARSCPPRPRRYAPGRSAVSSTTWGASTTTPTASARRAWWRRRSSLASEMPPPRGRSAWRARSRWNSGEERTEGPTMYVARFGFSPQEISPRMDTSGSGSHGRLPAETSTGRWRASRRGWRCVARRRASPCASASWRPAAAASGGCCRGSRRSTPPALAP